MYRIECNVQRKSSLLKSTFISPSKQIRHLIGSIQDTHDSCGSVAKLKRKLIFTFPTCTFIATRLTRFLVSGNHVDEVEWMEKVKQTFYRTLVKMLNIVLVPLSTQRGPRIFQNGRKWITTMNTSYQVSYAAFTYH